jgi:hypothetical protein
MPSDFETLPGSFSVLKLSDDVVSGYITSIWEGKQTIPWKDFEKKLNSIMGK